MLSNMSQVGGWAPPTSAVVTFSKALTGQTAHSGCLPSAVSAIAAPLPAAWMSRANRSSGSNGTSQGLTANAVAPDSRAHARPALTPESGPAGSPGLSCRTLNPSARARASASVPGRAFTATAEQSLCRRLTAHMSNGRPASTATAFSPPKRTDRPPAMTTPTTGAQRRESPEAPAARRGTTGSEALDSLSELITRNIRH